MHLPERSKDFMAYGSNLQTKIYHVHSLIRCHNSLVRVVNFYGIDDKSFIPNKGLDIWPKPALLPACIQQATGDFPQ
jgi:hypothetical protein